MRTLFFAAYSLLHLGFVFGLGTPPVRVSLRTAWPAPPILEEIIETAGLVDPPSFFSLVSLLSPLGPLGLPAGETYARALALLKEQDYFPTSSDVRAFELEMATHKMNPMVSAHYHVEDNASSVPPCEDWVDWGDERVCEMGRLKELVDEGLWPARPRTFAFDHIHPHTASSDLPGLLHHASLSAPTFLPFHDYLMSIPHITYVIRWARPTNLGTAPAYLSAWGVGLDLKKTEYSSMDDRVGKRATSEQDEEEATQEKSDSLIELISSLAKQAVSMSTSIPSDDLGDDVEVPVNDGVPTDNAPEPADSNEDFANEDTAVDDEIVDLRSPLTSDEQLALPQQATEIIIASPDPLNTLSTLVCSFPSYASLIARSLPPPPPVAFQPVLPSGYSTVWLNGAQVSSADFNAFNLPRLLRKETHLVRSLSSLGLTLPQASLLLSNSSPPALSGGGENAVTEGRVDIREIEGEEGVILWWNDVSKDSRYKRWPSNLSGLIRPVYPGQFHPIAANIYNVVVYCDLSSVEALNFVAGYLATIVQRGAPVRMGIVGGGGKEGRAMARVVHYLVKTFGRSITMQYITSLVTDSLMSNEKSISLALARKRFNTLVSFPDTETEEDIKSWEEVIETAQPFADVGEDWAQRLGVAGEYGGFVNGRWLPLDDDFIRNMQNELSQVMQYLQGQVYYNRIDDTEDIATYFYRLPGSIKRRNRHIEPSADNKLRVTNLADLLGESGWQSHWIWPVGEDVIPISIWILADFSSPKGIALIRNALSAMTTDSPFRISFIPSSAELPTTAAHDVAALFFHLSKADRFAQSTAEDLLELMSSDAPSHPELEELITESQRALVQETSGTGGDTLASWLAQGAATAQLFGIQAGESAIVINGRVVGPLEDGAFESSDFHTLAAYELRKRVQPVVDGLHGIERAPTESTRPAFADLVALASSITSATQVTDPAAEGLFNAASPLRNLAYKELSRIYSSFSVGNSETAIHRFGLVLDPVSDLAQKWSSLLMWLSSLESVYIEIILNPRIDGTEAPLKTYYRASLPFNLSFDSYGREIRPIAQFDDLPIEPIYTLAMDTPAAWVVRPRESPYDLDNIFLAAVPDSTRSVGVEAVFELEYLVVEGHAREGETSIPPRGAQVQITAGINNSTPLDDTMIVANLGYMQLKTQPGVYELQLRPGRSSEVFEMVSVGNEGWNSGPVNETGPYITVTSFEGVTIYPRFARRSGMEHADVLQDSYPPHGMLSGVLSSLSSFFGPSEPKTEVDPRQAEINIFTVASGLLYERFAFIMTLSVMRHTNSTVKFWFIENFLSPSFLEIIPHVAEQYGFQYELVTYKWPSWLRAQKEKQRVIWAYKILFLDILFPMDLKKVIFVDADQIVRTDLKELVDLDLHGAPYGYTPMGDDREDMEGFRFWKTGYWKEALRGKPYHISALYVIDLLRFRQMAAGDRLRGSYQGLSADPNSLSNLDQDLPNNMQHDIPIFSLDKDWLWCETWCSGDRLAQAKTIDLCQNPLTKEPKLVRARQIPEWEVYDSEVSALTRRLAEEGKIHWSAAMAGADALANVGQRTADPSDSGREEQTVDAGVTEEVLDFLEPDTSADGHGHDEL